MRKSKYVSLVGGNPLQGGSYREPRREAKCGCLIWSRFRMVFFWEAALDAVVRHFTG